MSLTEADRTSADRSEEKFRSIVETTSEWIWTIDRRRAITYSNPAVEQILGYRPDELVGLSLQSLVHEDDLPKAKQILSTSLAAKQGWAGFIVRCRRKDDTYRYLECHGVPIFDAAGDVVGFRGSDRDITERKHVEEGVRDAHRMEGIGLLAGGFAHHFNNLLAVIAGHVEMALESSGGQTVEFDLQAIRQAAQRGALLTRQLLTFAGKQIVAPGDQPQRSDRGNAHDAGPPLARHRVRHATGVGTLECQRRPRPADLVLMNLAVNAQEAMPTAAR
jgi:PAS domain S-box-containing protein